MKNILATLAFYARHNVRHSFAKDRSTVRAIRSLERAGFLTVDWPSRTAFFTGKVFSNIPGNQLAVN
jgi:hypothetical protein